MSTEADGTGNLPYSSSKPPLMETDYILDMKTHLLYNIKTLKYFDVKTGMDSDEDYIPEPDLEQTKPEEPEPEESDYPALLKEYDVSENPAGNLQNAQRFIRENLRDKQKDMASAIIKQYVLSHFKLNKEFQILTSFQKGIFAEYKEEEKARKKEEEKAEKERKEAEKEAKRKAEEESKKQSSDQFNDPIVNEVENGLIASIEFEGSICSFKTIYAVDKWQTTLCLNGKLLVTEEHESPMYMQDKKRDNFFAKRIMVEFGKTGPAKYLKPIYALIDIINENRDILDALQKKAILEAEEEKQRKISEENKKKNEHIITKARLYDTLCNKSGECTVEEIIQAKRDLRKQMMPDFWDVEGASIKTGNPGHLSLQKLAIANYMEKAYNLI
jgi:hypothetical protein